MPTLASWVVVRVILEDTPSIFTAIVVVYRNRIAPATFGTKFASCPAASVAGVRILGTDVQHTAYRLDLGSGRGASHTVAAPATVVYASWPRTADRVTDDGALGCGQFDSETDARIVVADGSDSATVTCRSR
jgi:hypothetical protein